MSEITPEIIPLEDRELYYGDIDRIREELATQSDRGAAIVGVALLDSKLQQVIERSFPEQLSQRKSKGLFGPTAPLGTYDGKVRLANALGLLDDSIIHDFNLLGRIRNRFAHNLTIREFADPGIAPLCEQLQGYRVEHVPRTGAPVRVLEYRGPTDARAAFLLTVDTAVHFVFIYALGRFGRFRRNEADSGDVTGV